MPRSPDDHADNWDLRHEDFNDIDFLYDVYSAMRQKGPFAHTETPFFANSTDGGAWVVLGYEDCQQMSTDWQHFSNNPLPEGAERLAGDIVIILDPPRHQSFRKVLNPYFSPGRMKLLEPQIRAETDLLLDAFVESGTGDLAHVAWRQPGVVIFKYLLGMPVDDVPACIELTDTSLNGDSEQAQMTAWGELYTYVHDAVTARESQRPRDDVIDALLSAEIDGKKLEIHEVAANAMLLVQAGLETTASAMSFAFHYLAAHAEERDRLVADPTNLGVAVEELIRFAGSIHGIPRTVRGDVEVNGHRFCPGQSVLLNYASANRDGSVFPNPDECVLDRKVNPHLGFGAGIHRCLGSNLARAELRIGLEQVLSRIPDYTIDSNNPPVFRGNSITRGFHRIPVVFTAGGRLKSV